MRDPDSFWKLLIEGRSGITEVPEERWNVGRYYDPDPQIPGKMITRWGGFLKAVDQFDARFFGISPREALRMDPQQRWLLEVTWEALEDGGVSPDVMAGSKTGVYVGIASNDYANIQMRGPSDVDVHTNSGSTLSIASNRISFLYDFKGPSVSVDTACSSALVAINLACQSIWEGQCEMALAGGVNALLTPDASIGFSKASMLSPDGQCYAFDARANGYVRGEGAGMLFIKPLSVAQAEGNPVYALIRAAVVNQDGRTNAMTVPGVESQSDMLVEAYRQAGISPKRVNYMEAHGTGTPVGDPIELEALGNVLCKGRAKGEECVIGSVKTNVGHLESGSGVAGIVKAALVLKEGTIPPNLNFETPNPNISFEKLRLRVPTEAEVLNQGSDPAIVAVNSFGFGGTNAHIVLEEAPARPKKRRRRKRAGSVGPLLFPVSANVKDSLKRYVAAHCDLLEAASKNGRVPLADIVGTAALRKSHQEHRLAVVGESAEELAEKLRAWERDEKLLPGVVYERASPKEPKVVFVFSGQGPQWWGMGQELLAREPVFLRAVKRIDRLLQKLGGWSLIEEMSRNEENSRIDRTYIAQPAIFALQVGLAELWRSRGVEPSRVVGHSVGEVAAAYWAGAYSLEDAVSVIFHRSRLQDQTGGSGRMVAVGLAKEDAQKAIQGYETQVAVAAINGPSMVTLAGDTEALETVVEALEEKGTFVRWLLIDYAFHTHQMDPIKDELLESLAHISPKKSRVPFVSTVTAGVVNGEELDADYWWRNVRNPVRFSKAVRTILDAGDELFLELGPHPIHSSAIKECLTQAGRKGTVIASLRRQEPERGSMLEAAGYLYGVGYPLKWTGLQRGATEFVRLPSYPWNHESFWLESEESRAQRLAPLAHPLLGVRVSSPKPTWECELDPRAFSYLEDHRFWDSMVFPAAGFAEIGLAVAKELFPADSCAVEDIKAEKALFYSESNVPKLRVIFDDADSSYYIYSSFGSRTDWELNAHGRVQRFSPVEPKGADLAALRTRLGERVDHEAYYCHYEEAGYQFGPLFQQLESVWKQPGESVGKIVVPDEIVETLHDYLFHPTVLDACFHCVKGAQVIPEGRTARESFYLPASIRRVRLYGTTEPILWGHAVLSHDDGDIVEADISVFNEKGDRIADILGFRVERVEQSDSGSESDLRRCFYQFEWKQRHLWGSGISGSVPFSVTRDIIDAVDPTIDEVYEKYELNRYFGEFMPAVEKLVIPFITNAFLELGWKPIRGAKIRFDSFVEDRGIIQQHHRLTRSFLNALTEESIVKPVAEDEWEILEKPEPSDALAGFDELAARYPRFESDLELEIICGSRLGEILSGKTDPMGLMFPGGSTERFANFYKEGADFQAFNDLIQTALSKAIDNLPAHRTLRVLEVGAGTGSLTRTVLPILPADRTEFSFTDNGPVFLNEARKEFGAFEFVDYRLLDIEKDPVEQGMQLHSFDLILATDVLHATSDLTHTLSVIKDLLASEGLLLFLEVTVPRRALDIVFGLLRGWWQYTDAKLRTVSALLPRPRWEKLLTENGFGEIGSFVDSPNDQEVSQAVFLSRGPEVSAEIDAESEEQGLDELYLVLADHSGTGEALADRLRQSNRSCLVASASEDFAKLDDWHYQFRPESTEDLDALFSEVVSKRVPLRGVIHCLSVDHPATAGMSSVSLDTAQHSGVLSALLLTKALVAASLDPAPRVWLVTRGTQYLEGDGEIHAIAAAPLTGFARVANNEHQEFSWTLVDLDPSESPEHVEALFEEITLDDGEQELAFRSGVRYGNRFIRASHDDLPNRCQDAVGGEGAPIPFRLEIPTPGVLDNLSLNETTRRPPGEGEVEVEVAAGGINFRDVMKALGIYPGDVADLKWLGDDFSGTVVGVGSGVSDLAMGDEVVGMAPYCFRSHLTIDRLMVFRKPDHMSFEEAATLPTVYLTAHYALNHLAHLARGERVLIHSGTGGVGQAAIRIAHGIGAEVFSTASTPEKRQMLKDMGVAHVMNSRNLDFADEIMEITAGAGVDVVLNSSAGEFIRKSLSVLAPYGRFLEIGKVDIYQNTKIGLEPFKNNISYFAIDLAQHLENRPQFVASMLQELSVEFAEKRLKPLPVCRFPVTEASEAFRFMAQAKHIGKNVLSFDLDSIPIGPPSDTKTLFKADASYLITGGASGFGLEVAKWMAGHGARNLILLSRSGPKTDGEKADIVDLIASGVNISDMRADVTEAQGIADVLARVQRDLPPLKGVIHGAMVLDDDFIKNLDVERFSRVLRTKMMGAWHLHLQTAHLPLDHFISFSSISSMFGASRQSCYCAGNYFLDSLAHYRHALGLPAITVNWGALLGAGFVERDEMTAQYLDAVGMKPFQIEEALEIFADILRKDPVQLGVARIDWKLLSRVNPTLVGSRVFSLIAQEETADGSKGGDGSIRPTILKAPPEERLKLVEDYICQQVAQVFGTNADDVERDTPLTQIGLDSLMAIELMNRIESNLGISLPMSQFLQGPDIKQLAIPVLELLIKSGDGDLEIADSGTESATKLTISDPSVREFPLSIGQRALWFLNQLAPDSSAYNLVFSSRISPYVDIPVMEEAFSTLFRRHPMLDVTIEAADGDLRQFFHEGRTIDFREHDATELSEGEIKELLIEHAHKPFDLVNGPVVRLELFRTADNAHVALLCMHHIVSDAWSVVLILNDLIEGYFSIKSGITPEFKPLDYRYLDYVKWQGDLLQSSESEKMAEFWVEELENAPMVLDLSTDHPRPAVQSFNGSTHGFTLNESLTKKIEDLASERNVTLFTLLLSAFQVLLHRYCNQDDLLVGSPFAGRSRQEFHDLVGYFINPVALRSRVEGDPLFSDYLEGVSTTVIGALENQEYPLASLVDRLKVPRDSSRSPIFQVTFSMERIPGVDEQGIAVFLIGQGGHVFNVRDISVESIDLNLRQAQFEISLVVEEAGGNIYGCWQYNRDLFEPETIARLNSLYEQVLEDVVRDPGQRISEISFLSSEEEKKILEEWNATASDCPEETCVHQLFSEHAVRMPNAVAVTSAGRSLTYRELNRRANGLAAKLKSAGVGLESPVGIFIDRSVDLLVGILGILKAGGCYVPLDPAFPSFRLEQMLSDARPGVVVTGKSLRRSLPQGDWETICVEDCGEAMAPPVVKGQTSESLAYIIYTSGSTGKPKGVEIPHRAVVNFLISMRETPGLSADDTLLAVTTLSFDISVLELLLPLISDARVVIATRQEATDGRRIAVLLDEYAVTTMQATPATWQMLLDSGWNGKHDLRVFCGGEMLGRELAEELLPRTRAVWNLYGPTETTIWSTVDKVSGGGGAVSIGRPIANTTVYILDDNHRALPPGFTGSLYIGGDGLARGYHGLPEMTAERFLEVTLPNGRRELLYHTGDMARFRTDGKIDFLGRNDSQVKLRGYRIELEDIETHLMNHSYVKQAVVMKRDDLPSEGLVAYIIPRDGREGIVSVLRSFMLERLPEYMRPSSYVILDEYPLTPNKKIDRGRLPAPILQRSDLQVAYIPPRTPSERILIDILSSAFKSDKVGIHDNFFDLGGDSLLAVQILTEVSQAFNRRLPVEVFLQNPTVENLARYIDTPAGIVEAGDGDNLLATGGYANEELDSDYLTVTITDRESDDDAELSKVDAVALAYIPDGFLALTGLSKEDIVHNWLRGEPYLSNVYQTSFGSIGLIMLPRLGTELYKDQDVLADQVVSAMEMAVSVGAARVSLTGLIPSATDYGRKVVEWMSKCRQCPEVTTGHATTTATIIRSVEGLLEDTGRDFAGERVAIVGLGSIGYASLQLMLEVLPHPRELILCDLYQKSEVLEEIRRELVESVNFRGRIRLETSRGRLPDAVYSASFVLGATNVPGILDVRRLQPGTLIVDDSFPPCFRVFDAIKRLETDHDILFTTGGLIRLNEEIEETIYLPSGTASLLEELGENQLLALAGRDSREITGCILSSLVSGSRPEIKCTLGRVTLEDSLAHYRFLQSSGFEAARPQCENYFISPKAVARFNEVKASEAARTSSV